MTLETWQVLSKLHGYRVDQAHLPDTVWYAWDGRACKGAWLSNSCCLYKRGTNSRDTLVVNE